MFWKLVFAMVFVSGSAASAVEFSVLGATTVTIYQGDSFSINIALDNASLTPTNGVIGEITGLLAAGTVVTSGVSARYHFAIFCAQTACFGGLTSTGSGGFFNDSDLSSGLYNPLDDSVVIVFAVTFPETTASGALDPGLAGVGGSHHPSDVFITFTASKLGSHVLSIGGTFSQSGVQPITSTATFTVNVIPEPGTALLVGLGLAGLAAAGRRRAGLA